MPLRFVILHHRQDQGEHWDLMLERGEVLATWQLPADPTGPAHYPMAARRIGDHRMAYLTYEGPVSGDRGEVRRVDAGTYESHAESPEGCEFSAVGTHFRGRFALRRDAAGRWTLERQQR